MHCIPRGSRTGLVTFCESVMLVLTLCVSTSDHWPPISDPTERILELMNHPVNKYSTGFLQHHNQRHTRIVGNFSKKDSKLKYKYLREQ